MIKCSFHTEYLPICYHNFICLMPQDNANQQLSTSIHPLQGDYSPASTVSSYSGSSHVEALGSLESTEEIQTPKDIAMITGKYFNYDCNNIGI